MMEVGVRASDSFPKYLRVVVSIDDSVVLMVYIDRRKTVIAFAAKDDGAENGAVYYCRDYRFSQFTSRWKSRDKYSFFTLLDEYCNRLDFDLISTIKAINPARLF